MEKSGADIIRLWAAAADYSQDISISDDILARTSDAYRRMRNTFRFLLSNLYDYEPEMAVAWEDMPELDRYALVRLGDVVDRVTNAYDDWKFHQVYHTVFNYCVTDLSSFYLDVLKDRLYSDATDSVSRRSAQTVLARILVDLVRVVAPVLSFTAEEVWQFAPEKLRDGAVSVHLAGWPEVEVPAEEAGTLRDTYGSVLEVRDVVTKALEDARNDDVVKKSQEAAVTVTAPAETIAVMEERGHGSVAEMLIVSSVELIEGDELSATVQVAEGGKCPRCWNVRELGSDAAHPELCARCAEVLG
jgi:isoleucyl-tRNA synthetase